jgi:hypothetical protein
MRTRASQGDVLSRTVRSPARGTRSRRRDRWRLGLKPARCARHASHGVVGEVETDSGVQAASAAFFSAINQ